MENKDILPDSQHTGKACWDDETYAHIPEAARASLRANGDLIKRFLDSDLGRREARTTEDQISDKRPASEPGV